MDCPTLIVMLFPYYTCRSIGVANFNVKHLTELKKARPDHIPAGENFCMSIKCVSPYMHALQNHEKL